MATAKKASAKPSAASKRVPPARAIRKSTSSNPQTTATSIATGIPPDILEKETRPTSGLVLENPSNKCLSALAEDASAPPTEAQLAGISFPYLLVTHLVCADEQVHIEEYRKLFELGEAMKICATTKEEAQKILNQCESRLRLGAVALRIPKYIRGDVLDLLLTITYLDGFSDPLERIFLDEVTRIWKFNPHEVEHRCAQAEKLHAQLHIRGPQTIPDELSIAARAFKGVDRFLPRTLMESLYRVVPPRINERIAEMRQEILLAGPEYDLAIKKCETVANQDIETTERVLEDTQLILRVLMDSFSQEIETLAKSPSSGTAESAREVIAYLRANCDNLDNQICQHIERVRISLQRKKRATKYFTVSFLGKTKAGKSTLHAVVTNDGWDGIGVGTQRTTRLNRVYQWKSMRVIDTPGIGAPGGKSDEEIAKSVIDESDVICFVVTNNNQQESEFQFLRLLKERAKPLVILLNVQEDLTKAMRMERFLKAPDSLFSEDKRYLGGHFDRIRRYAETSYGNDYFEIVPVQLLAAQFARQDPAHEHSSALYRNSRLQQFLDAIRIALVEHGVIRRSQTLLGSTVADIQEPLVWSQKVENRNAAVVSKLREQRESALKRLTDAEHDAKSEMTVGIQKAFTDLRASVALFAEDHWDCDEKSLNEGWTKLVKSKHLEKRLNNAILAATTKYQNEVASVLDEIGKDMQLIDALELEECHLGKQSSSTFVKNAFKWGGSLLCLAPLVLGGPPGWIALGVGLVAQFFSWLLEDKATKRRNAVEAISQALLESVDVQKKKSIKRAERDFKKHSQQVRSDIEEYFDGLIEGLAAIGQALGKAKEALDLQISEINLAYAYRILEWAAGAGVPGGIPIEKGVIASIDRQLGRKMTIQLHKKVSILRSDESIKQVLQENVNFCVISTAT